MERRGPPIKQIPVPCDLWWLTLLWEWSGFIHIAPETLQKRCYCIRTRSTNEFSNYCMFSCSSYLSGWVDQKSFLFWYSKLANRRSLGRRACRKTQGQFSFQPTKYRNNDNSLQQPQCIGWFLTKNLTFPPFESENWLGNLPVQLGGTHKT